ncbi:MAG: hypothetical protein EOP45_03100 [Sphingobacteriaceae bacterium]|nr:MAG: hypothetical protein EOP45_03100 [Sphingobacteriaceae bacterium]
MELTELQLQEIEDFAYKYLEKFEIAFILQLPDPRVLEDDLHPAYIRFRIGRLKRKAEYNHTVIKLSDQLSSPAQAIEAKMAERIFLNDKKTL